MENKDKPAFATDPRIAVTSGDPRSGLTKREYFAAMAMQGVHAALFSNFNMVTRYKEEGQQQGFQDMYDYIAVVAIRQADELLKQLESNP